MPVVVHPLSGRHEPQGRTHKVDSAEANQEGLDVWVAKVSAQPFA